MTQEIQKNDWKAFFDGANRDFHGWETTVQVMNDNTGVQILSEGLPFNGLTFDDRNGREVIELDIGSGTENHQTHNISEPTKVAFEVSGHGASGTLDIEDASGTKTLINFMHPMPVLAEYVAAEMIAVS